MILVDTSAWIELPNGRLNPIYPMSYFSLSPSGRSVQEVLQGLREVPAGETFREGILAVPCLSDPLPLDVFRNAADIYRQGRSRGYTIRSSTDCLIAAIAMENKVPVWHRDRDFPAIASYTPLKAVTQLKQVKRG